MRRMFSIDRRISSLHVVFTFATMLAVAWCAVSPPGVYHGSLRGSFYLMSDPNEDPKSWSVTVEAESAPAWRWSSLGSSPQYPVVNLQVDSDEGKRAIDVEFPGPEYKVDGKTEPLSEQKFAELVLGSADSLPRQTKALHEFVQAAGNGTVQRPRHHPYHVDKPYGGSFTHFRLGQPAFLPVIGGTIGAWVAAGIAMRLARRRRRPSASAPGAGAGGD